MCNMCEKFTVNDGAECETACMKQKLTILYIFVVLISLCRMGQGEQMNWDSGR